MSAMSPYSCPMHQGLRSSTGVWRMVKLLFLLWIAAGSMALADQPQGESRDHATAYDLRYRLPSGQSLAYQIRARMSVAQNVKSGDGRVTRSTTTIDTLVRARGEFTWNGSIKATLEGDSDTFLPIVGALAQDQRKSSTTVTAFVHFLDRGLILPSSTRGTDSINELIPCFSDKSVCVGNSWRLETGPDDFIPIAVVRDSRLMEVNERNRRVARVSWVVNGARQDSLADLNLRRYRSAGDADFEIDSGVLLRSSTWTSAVVVRKSESDPTGEQESQAITKHVTISLKSRGISEGSAERATQHDIIPGRGRQGSN